MVSTNAGFLLVFINYYLPSPVNGELSLIYKYSTSR